MSRLPLVNRDAVPENLRAAFDELIAANDGAVPIGPGMVAAMSPEMALRRRPLSPTRLTCRPPMPASGCRTGPRR